MSMWKIFTISILWAVGQARYENVNVKTDWWESAAFYQVYLRSFVDSDGDGVGDMNGLTNRMDYIKELGIDAIIISPVFKSPMLDYGYDISDYYSFNSEYGTNEDFEHLLRKASELNMKVLLDFVPNHTSNESEWFIKSANRDEYYSDWYIWENGHIDSAGNRRPPNNWISVFGKAAWSFSPIRDQFYLHQFGPGQPDLNYRNPVVVEEIKNIIKFWLEKGITGMRLSSVNHIYEVDKDGFGGRYPDEPPSSKMNVPSNHYDSLNHVYTKDLEEVYELIAQFREVFNGMSVRDNLTRIMITEANTTIKNAVKYYRGGNRAGAHIPLNFDLMENLDKESDARDVKYTVDRWMTYKPLKQQANWIIGNHDTSRVASRFRTELVDAYNMLVLLLPGLAMTYMGEELGMQNGFVPWIDTKDPVACNTDDPVNFVDVSRDPYRTPFQWNSGKNAGFSNAPKPWIPAADSFDVLNVANQRGAIRSHYQVYRTLTNLRLRAAFRLGRYEALALTNGVFAFKRWYNDDTYIVVMNFRRTYQVVNLTAFDLIFGQLEVEASSVLSTRTYSDNVHSTFLDLAGDEALVLRMQV